MSPKFMTFLAPFSLFELRSYDPSMLGNPGKMVLALCDIEPYLTLPNNKFLNWFKLRAFADDNLDTNQKFKYALGRVENIVGTGENTGN